jgi:pimeloyl-ACP methyl ester carboxylesterase
MTRVAIGAKVRRMTVPNAAGFESRCVLVALALTSCAQALAETRSESIELAGTRIEYRVVLPLNLDPTRRYPGVLAFPGAGQTLRNVDTMLERNWTAEAERRGYIVVSPAAPDLGLYFQRGDTIFPEFLDRMLERYPIDRAAFHVAGVSNGGASAFHIAAAHSGYFRSVTGLPGYLPYASAEKLESLAKLCVYMHVGELDEDWLTTMKYQAQQLTDAGAALRFWVERGQGHIMESLSGAGAARLFEHFRDAEAGCSETTPTASARQN